MRDGAFFFPSVELHVGEYAGILHILKADGSDIWALPFPSGRTEDNGMSNGGRNNVFTVIAPAALQAVAMKQ